MYTFTTPRDVVLLWEWHLCLTCYRMFNLNIMGHVKIPYKCHFLYAHLHCPPLKEACEPLRLGAP